MESASPSAAPGMAIHQQVRPWCSVCTAIVTMSCLLMALFMLLGFSLKRNDDVVAILNQYKDYLQRPFIGTRPAANEAGRRAGTQERKVTKARMTTEGEIAVELLTGTFRADRLSTRRPHRPRAALPSAASEATSGYAPTATTSAGAISRGSAQQKYSTNVHTAPALRMVTAYSANTSETHRRSQNVTVGFVQMEKDDDDDEEGGGSE